jgi:hypothetical protein
VDGALGERGGVAFTIRGIHGYLDESISLGVTSGFIGICLDKHMRARAY